MQVCPPEVNNISENFRKPVLYDKNGLYLLE